MAEQAREERPGTVHLSGDDEVRMARLYEEVAGHVMEMSLIVARTLGKDSEFARELMFVRRLRPPESGQEEATDEPAARPREGTEIIHFADCKFGCYDHGRGVCFPC